MKQLNKFEKSKFYIFLVCNFWTILSTLEMISIVLMTTALYKFFGNSVLSFILYLTQFGLGIGYFIYANYGMIGSYPKRVKLYNMLVDSIENNKFFKKSLVYEMMASRCNSHIIYTLNRNFGIKLY